MSDVEHKVAMYQLATERRKAGLPVWAHTIDVSHIFHNDELTFEEKRTQIVAAIKASRWYKMQDPYTFDGLWDLVDNLETDDADSFDYWWFICYFRTPISSYRVRHHDLTAALTEMLRILEGK